MANAIRFGLLGLGASGAYALLALGLVAIHRGSGVVNFAHGAFAMVGGFVYWDLTNHGWHLWPAAIVAVVIVTALGFVVSVGLMQRLRHSSPLARLIGTLAVMFALTSAGVLLWGGGPQTVASILPQVPVKFDVFGVKVTAISDRIIIIGLVLFVALLLSLFYRFTVVGLAMHASAENEGAAAGLGWSPNRLATSSWVLGAALAGIAGVLIAPIATISVETTTLFVVPALAAALFASFTSVWGTLLGAVVIGTLQSEIVSYSPTWFGAAHSQGLSDAVPLLIIVIVLVVRGVSLPVRGHLSERLPSLGTAGSLWVVPAVGGVVVAVTFAMGSNLLAGVLGSSIACLLILSLVVLTGYTGQISLGQYALAGIGAYVTARLVGSLGVPFPIAVVAGVLATVPLSLLFALPALRTRGVNLAIITLGLGLAVNSVFFQNATYTGGANGINVHNISFFGLSLNPVVHLRSYVVFSVVCVVIAMLIVRNIRRSRTGRRMFAVRSNERAAASLGISPRGIKFFAFGVSAGIAALGGIILAFSNQVIVFSNYDPLSSISTLLYATVGGIGYLGGMLPGSQMNPNAIVGSVLSNHFGSATNWISFVGSLGVIAALLQSPNGVTAQLRRRFPARQRPTDLGDPAGLIAPVKPLTLEVRDLSFSIGDSHILQNVSFRVDPGRIVGLIGPNGAGKTMCIDAITGFVRPGSGSVVLGGESITDWSASRRARAGITRSFQSLELFEDIAVIDNLRTASDDVTATAYVTDLVHPRQPAIHATARAAIEEFHLASTVDKLPGDLPFGDRRLVSIARAVATNPSVLLLDEPASGLSDRETAELATLLTRLARSWGIGILLVEHDMSMVMSVCDEITVLEFGQTVASGTPEQVRADQKVIKAYLGTSGMADVKLPVESL